MSLKQEDNIYLTGFMGSGKSVIGERLAGMLDMNFLDTDRMVEKRAGMSIESIFDIKGEEGFRALENGVIHEACKSRGSVVALGGGALAAEGNLDMIGSSGILFYLKVPADVLASRLEGGASRPLIAGIKGKSLIRKINSMLSAREHLYSSADYIVDCGSRPEKALAKEIYTILGGS